jgi:hypothetical protein
MAAKSETAKLRAALDDVTAAVEHLVAALRVGNTQSLERFEVGRDVARAALRVGNARKQLDMTEE